MRDVHQIWLSEFFPIEVVDFRCRSTQCFGMKKVREVKWMTENWSARLVVPLKLRGKQLFEYAPSLPLKSHYRRTHIQESGLNMRYSRDRWIARHSFRLS